MKKYVLSAAVLLLSSVAVFAQGAPKKVLDAKGLDSFIAGLPGIIADLSALGVDDLAREEESFDGAMPSKPYHEILKEGLGALKKNAEARKILAKHGWGESFWDYYYTVTVSAFVQMVEASLTPEVPAQIRDQVKSSRAAVHADDHALVLKNMDRIAGMFESLDEE